jgi:uncharacterized protein (TIGR02271 family)
MTTRTITAIYDSEADAKRARERLVGVGIDDDDVRIVGQQLSRSAVSSDTGGREDKGWWESIKDFFVGDEDRPAYSEGLRRGGYLLTARVEDDLTDEAIGELEQTNPIDLEERSAQWRTEGWSATAVSDEEVVANDRSMGANEARGEKFAGAREARTTDAREDSAQEAIPIVEERLRVGKREVDRGSVRVRSYIVEQPIHEDVSLREERVEIERRPASDVRTRSGEDLLQERTIEMRERGEEAVVAKDAVVTEELVVRKSADERIDSIDETVRRTEVEVDDTRTRAENRKTPGGADKPKK